jgi:hypothetical protein
MILSTASFAQADKSLLAVTSNQTFAARRRHNPERLKKNSVVESLSSPARENIATSLLTQITFTTLAVPSHAGAYRDRHGRGAECDGRGWRIDERAYLADGKAVWS